MADSPLQDGQCSSSAAVEPKLKTSACANTANAQHTTTEMSLWAV